MVLRQYVCVCMCVCVVKRYSRQCSYIARSGDVYPQKLVGLSLYDPQNDFTFAPGKPNDRY